MLRARRQERLREVQEQRQKNVLMFTDKLLAQYMAQKPARSADSTRKAFKLMSSNESIKDSAEKDRDKGGGFLKKKPEEQLEYSRLYLFPCVLFEYQYLKKKGIFGSKIPHNGSSIFSIYEQGCQGFWRPDLIKEIEESGLTELKEGYLIDLEQEQAEHEAAGLIAEAKYCGTESSSLWKKNLNLEVPPEELQGMLKVDVVYLPYWIAKFKTPSTTRRVVYDRFGKKDKVLNERINANLRLAEDIEKNALKL